jgi:hypothetical protein
MSAADNLTAWLAANPEPSAQQLAERYGGYAQVPVDEWTKLDRPIVARRAKRMPHACPRRLFDLPVPALSQKLRAEVRQKPN